ncbi:MAG: bifunctional transcriptional activator/DNA repair protein Ada, partial [Clostridia bacterium]|nr:bifunctional transcriptional activator/DNA repair protein Ada [Clostridia bacterium]
MFMTNNEKYTALVEKDPAYDGAFFAAVKTTGIFCRTTCTARKPKQENVCFYDTIHDALAAGYRPCKICRPMESANQVPEDIAALLAEVQANPQFRITEWQLKQRGLDPNTLRRWFQKHYGMTFQAFCRMNRINTAFGAIKDGNSVLDAALESGYSSASGFASAFDKIIGTAPGRIKREPRNVLVYQRFDAPLGPMVAIASEKGLCLLEFGDRRMLESEFTDLQKRLDAVLLPGKNEFTEEAVRQILEYFAGTRKTFSVPLHAPGTVLAECVPGNGLLAAGTRLAGAPLDHAAGALGAGCAEPGCVSETIGCTLALCAPHAGLVYDGARRISTYEGFAPGQYVLLPWAPAAGLSA